MSKSRVFYLDVMRIVACLSVTFQHALLPWIESYGDVFKKCDVFMFESGSELFCMISGACLLGRVTDTKTFLKKRFIRIIPIVIFWTTVYLLLTKYLYGFLPRSYKFYYASMSFSYQESHLWFIYCISGLYLLTPILNRWLAVAKRREVEFFLLIWTITSFIPVFEHYIAVGRFLPEQTWHYYFSGYIGYYLLGYYLNKYRDGVNNLFFAITTLVLSLVFLYLNILCDWGDSGLENAEIGCLLMTFGLFVLIQKIADKSSVIEQKYHEIIEKIAKLTFGVYLVHVVFDKWLYLNFPYGNMEVWERVLIDFGITVVASFLVVWLLSYLPFSRFIVGNHISLRKDK